MAQLVPKNKAPGVDFCTLDCLYIIRSDLGCYMTATNLNEGTNLKVFSLHNSCRGGDHYIGHKEDNFFYIIKGNQYRRVADMNTDKNATVHVLHPNCRGGDFYLSAFKSFYIIFQNKGVYRQVSNLDNDKDAVEYTLHPNCKNGLYYWGITDYYYFMKPHDQWGAQYFRCTDFHQNTDPKTYSFHSDVVNFLPGGLGITQGVCFGRWEAIKTISNDSESPITWNKKITRKVGYTRQKMSTIENNWKVNIGASYQSGALTEAIAKYQFSISTEFGGSEVNTEQEEWSEATEIEESICVVLQPKEKMYIWQYEMGMGKESVLFCRSMKFTSDSKPPEEIPLPNSKW